METNLRIIKLVQRRPVLYTKCNNFHARANQWKEVADILKIDVSLVKSRWYLLKDKFTQEYCSALKGKHSTFKYLDDMAFLVNHVNLVAFQMHSKESYHYKTQPEFNITKKDLEEISDDDDSTNTNEFIELELDEDSQQEELPQIRYGDNDTEDTSQNEYIEPIYVDECSNPIQPEQGQDMSPNNKLKERQVETFLEVKGNIERVLIKEPPKQNIEEKCKTDVQDLEEKPCLTDKQEEIPKSIPEKQPVSDANANKNENYRCEDTIFGELVIATLREMQCDKKKAVKREIMNILFT